MTLGENIKRLRKKLKMTQTELAEKSGIARATIGFYERDEQEPPASRLAKICYALGTTPNDILNFEKTSDFERYQLYCARGELWVKKYSEGDKTFVAITTTSNTNTNTNLDKSTGEKYSDKHVIARLPLSMFMECMDHVVNSPDTIDTITTVYRSLLLGCFNKYENMRLKEQLRELETSYKVK